MTSTQRRSQRPSPRRRQNDVPAPTPEPTVYRMPEMPRRGRPNLIVWAVVAVAAGQLLLPDHLKPFHLAGAAAAQFHGELFDAVNAKDLEKAEQEHLARELADLQVEYSTWKGRCSLLTMFDRPAGAVCMQGADTFYHNALAQIRRSELRYRNGR